MKQLAVVVGAVGKLPYAGMAFYWGHYLLGLQELGYDVHYVERLNHAEEAYDPATDAMTDDPGPALTYLADVLPRFGVSREQASFIDLEGRCHFSSWGALRGALQRASFALIVADPTWFDELELCERRCFVDGDPMFTQIELITVGGHDSAPAHCDVLFSYGTRVGADDCAIPDAGRRWIPTRPVVATSAWNRAPSAPEAPIVALLHWAAGGDVQFGGAEFGHKNREFRRFVDLPSRTDQAFAVAVDGGAPRAELAESGWELVNPLAVTGTIEAYRDFIAHSKADLGIAKHAYVASRSGWFSDRSTCYLASGRPVLHQDTGYTEWLDVDDGVLPFSDMDSLVAALERVDSEYERHAAAARRIAEEHFQARIVIGDMLDAAGFR
jgi:hypothetical protein